MRFSTYLKRTIFSEAIMCPKCLYFCFQSFGQLKEEGKVIISAGETFQMSKIWDYLKFSTKYSISVVIKQWTEWAYFLSQKFSCKCRLLQKCIRRGWVSIPRDPFLGRFWQKKNRFIIYKFKSDIHYFWTKI